MMWLRRRAYSGSSITSARERGRGSLTSTISPGRASGPVVMRAVRCESRLAPSSAAGSTERVVQGGPGYRASLDQEAALRYGPDPGDDVQDRALAPPRGADHRKNLPPLDAEGHRAEDTALPRPVRIGEELGHVVDLEESHGSQS